MTLPTIGYLLSGKISISTNVSHLGYLHSARDSISSGISQVNYLQNGDVSITLTRAGCRCRSEALEISATRLCFR